MILVKYDNLLLYVCEVSNKVGGKWQFSLLDLNTMVILTSKWRHTQNTHGYFFLLTREANIMKYIKIKSCSAKSFWFHTTELQNFNISICTYI